MIKLLSIITLIINSIFCDVSHLTNFQIDPKEEPEVEIIPKPYAFGYAAGRYPGHIDRTHSEISDGSGLVQGSYSYVDPRHQIRTVEYTADKFGFHPISNNDNSLAPKDTPIVAAAKQRHLAQFANIANSRNVQPRIVVVPVDSVAVNNAKNRHFRLYQKIAEEHARIAEEREKEQFIDESTSRPIIQKSE